MLRFPWVENKTNISGALCKTREMKPGAGGTLVYFTCEDCAVELSRVEKAGGKLLQEKFPIVPYGFCALMMDTEGNTVGLHSVK
jgi:uncharacterized protein